MSRILLLQSTPKPKSAWRMLGDILFEATIGQILTLYWWLRVKHGQAQLRRMKLKGRVQDIILQAYGLDRDEVLREAGWPMKTDVTPVTTDDPGGVELIRQAGFMGGKKREGSAPPREQPGKP